MYYIKDLNLHCGLDPHKFFPLFLNKIAVFLDPKLAKTFRGLIAAGSFPVLWRTANITSISKGSFSSPFSLYYKPISNTPIIYKSMKNLTLEGFINLLIP